EVHDSRQFTWGPQTTVRSPSSGQITEVSCPWQADDTTATWQVEQPSLRTLPREQVTASLRAALQLDSFQVGSSSRGRRQLLTLDLPFGGSCTFFIYFPPGYQ
ncbi:unnamed protein product, partial [Polarella glacialis]